jgi:RNA polymerase sigma-70 factor (ECF subfamily)
MDGQLSSHSDEALVKLAQNGSRAAFETLCGRHLSSVYSRLCALVPLEAAEDITQEVFIAALRGLERFKGRSLFRTWLASITRHKVADYYRKQGRTPSTVPLDDATANLARTDAWEERVLVRDALRRLPVHYQEVLLLRFAEGLPFKEIAQILNITLEASKSRYRRAIAAVAQEMETLPEDQEPDE